MQFLINEITILINFFHHHEEIVLLFIPVILALIPLFIKFSSIPNIFQSILELIHEFLEEQIKPLFHSTGDYERWMPLFISLFFFILISNLIGIVPGMHPLTSNLMITASLALIVISASILAGIQRKGLLKYFIELTPANTGWPIRTLMFPLEIVSLLAKPLSLTLRLYANMFAGHTIILIILSLTKILHTFIIPLDIIIVSLLLCFEIFVSLIQAYIFSYLSATYVAESLSSH